MLFSVIWVLSVVLGLCVAVHLVFHRLGSRVTWASILLTLIVCLFFSAVTEMVMITAIWPPVTLASWVLFAAFAGIVLLLLLTGNKKPEEGW